MDIKELYYEADTRKHQQTVAQILISFAMKILKRATEHDASKLEEPEKSHYIEPVFYLNTEEVPYGSDRYKELCKQMGPGWTHHKMANDHHIEFFEPYAIQTLNDPFRALDLFALVEMLADWIAASKRRNNNPPRCFEVPEREASDGRTIGSNYQKYPGNGGVTMSGKGYKGPDFPDPRDFRYGVRFKGSLPAEVDITLPPVENQYDVNCCVFKALTHIMEWAQTLGAGDNATPYYLSALYAYYQYRRKYGEVSVDDGAYIRQAIDLTAKLGTCNEGMWPFKEGQNWAKQPPILTVEDPRVHQISDYWTLAGEGKQETLDNILACLAERRPFMFGVVLYDSFENETTAQTGMVPYPNQKAEQVVGGHAMVAKGFRLKDEKIRIRNSWGSDWGLAGDCWVDFQWLLDFGADFWTVNIVTG